MSDSSHRPRSPRADIKPIPDALRAGPFTLAEAREAGVSRSALRSEQVSRVFHDVYIARSEPVSLPDRARCALATHDPGARISHHTAAALQRLPTPDHPDIHVSVARAQDRRRQPGLLSHVCRGRAVVADGIPMSDPVQLFCEMASLCAPLDAVILGDAIVRRTKTQLDRFRASVNMTRARAPARVAYAAGLIAAGVDSPMETRLRLLIALAGLPVPVVAHEFRDESGVVLARLDLAYGSVQVAVEYDGRQHAENTAQWQRDLHRREWLDNRGWRIIVVTAEGIFDDPETTLRRIREVLVGRGMACGPVLPDWRRHFLSSLRG